MATADYRQSHRSKGPEYHALFTENPRWALMWQLEQQVLRQVVGRFLRHKSIIHLDFACGTGRILAFLEHYTTQSVGVDVSHSMLETARTVIRRSRLVEADLTRHDALDGEQFDLITAFRFFPNAEPELRTAALRALAARLAPGGVLVFNNHRHTGALVRRLVRLLRRKEASDAGMTDDACRALLQSNGLLLARRYHIGIVPETERRFVRPRALAVAVERLGMELPVARWAENLIYVATQDG
jgi:predicted TPR repeat methyltransferase